MAAEEEKTMGSVENRLFLIYKKNTTTMMTKGKHLMQANRSELKSSQKNLKAQVKIHNNQVSYAVTGFTCNNFIYLFILID